MDGEATTRTILESPRQGEVARDERPYWSAARDLDATIEHLDLTAAHLVDRLQPFMGAGPESPSSGDKPQDISTAQAVARMEGAARAVRAIDSRLESLILGLLQI